MIRTIQANPLRVRRLERNALLGELKIDEPLVHEGWDQHPNPAVANEWAGRYDRITAARVEAQVEKGSEPKLPIVPADRAIFPGTTRGRIFALDLRWFNRHASVVGGTGSGKSTLIRSLIIQMLLMRVRVRMEEFKNDARQLLHVVPNAVVLRPNQVPVNYLEPVGHPDQYFSGLCQLLSWYLGAHVSSAAQWTKILIQLHQGRRAGEPFLSLRDLEEFLRRTAGRDQKLHTLLAGLESLNVVLGDTAYIRQGPPDWEKHFPLVIFEYQGISPRLYALLINIRVLRYRLVALSQPQNI